MREERGCRPLRAERAVEGDQAGGAPWRPVKAWVPAVGRFFPLKRREEREVCQRRQWWQASQSVCSQ